MKNIKIYALLVFGIVAFASCNDDFMDKQPLEAIPEDKIFEDPGLAEAFLNKVYSGIPHGFNRGWYMLDAASDDAENSYNWVDSNTILNTSSITSASSPFNWLWNNAYTQIRRVNEFIKNYDQLIGSVEVVNRLKGEAHFLRGFWYAELLKTFGGVPLVKVPQHIDDEDILVSRNTRAETMDFVISELNEAINYLSNARQASSARANVSAALALKGRVLLYEGKFIESAQASKEALESGHTLNNNYQDIFLEDGTSEVLFDVQFKDPDKGHWANLFNTSKSTTSISGWGGTGPTQNLVDAYEMKETGKMINEPESGYDEKNPYVGRDPRFYQSILYDGSMWKGQMIQTRPGGTEHIATSGDWTRTGYSLKKFMQEDRPFGDMSTQHWVFIRLGEVYLNYAEALIESGTDLPAAVEAINTIRRRSNMPDIEMASQDELRKKVRHERRIELAFEEHRFWDIRRWKIAGTPEVLTIYRMEMDENGNFLGRSIWETREWNDRDYIFPIPQYEMDKNPNLEQNPGYN